MKTIEKQCQECETSFNALIKEVKRGNARFCSLSCAARSNGRREKVPNVNCAFCNKRFYKKASAITKSKNKIFFCCRAHKDLAQRIGGIKEIQPPHYGTASGLHGYRVKAFKEVNDPSCTNCGYNKHKEVLQVHHIDRDRSNNALENLKILCPTCHEEEHFLTKTGRWGG